jgi:hypothetical protein
MKIAIIDADLIGRKKHRFPNLTCMKISRWHKNKGDDVILKTNYDNLSDFGKVYIAKVFTDTPIPESGLFGNILDLPNVEFGGTGFYYDNARKLPDEIEHIMPDYDLYNDWLQNVDNGGKEFKTYKDYSIGFLTRGCFRHCPFCVNRRSNASRKHSPLGEFLDIFRPKICLLDDNFFACEDWEYLLKGLIKIEKPFTFKQGLDVRLLDRAKAELLFNSNYDGDFIFAFDDVTDYAAIERKLYLIREFTGKRVKFYCLCGYDRRGKYDLNFWQKDLIDLFRRIELLMKYDAIPFVMKHANFKLSPYKKYYTQIARWCNQVQFYWKMSFLEFCNADGRNFPKLDFLDEKFLTMKRGEIKQ